MINDYQDERLAFLKGLKTWGTFGKGWGRRVQEVRSLALQMASAPIPQATIPKPIETRPEITLPPVNPPALKMNWFKLIWTALAAMLGRKS